MLRVFILLSGMGTVAAFSFHECRIQNTYFWVIIRWNDWLFGQTLSYCCCLFLSSLTLDRFVLVLCIAFDFLSFSFFLPLLGVKYAVLCILCNFVRLQFCVWTDHCCCLWQLKTTHGVLKGKTLQKTQDEMFFTSIWSFCQVAFSHVQESFTDCMERRTIILLGFFLGGGGGSWKCLFLWWFFFFFFCLRNLT